MYPFLLRCNTANTSVMKSATPDKGLLDSSEITFRTASSGSFSTLRNSTIHAFHASTA